MNNKSSQYNLSSFDEDNPKYDFIPDRKPKPSAGKVEESESEKDQTFRSKLEKVSGLAMNFRSSKKKSSRKKKKTGLKVSNSDGSKKVASFYLDKKLVRRLTEQSNRNGESTSELVEKAILEYLPAKESE